MSTVIVRKPGLIRIRDVSLFVDVIGDGYPLVLMHGGPGLDHNSLFPFRRFEDQFTVVFYDHRCNGRSEGAPLSSMTWENLTADADALREHLGFEKWAVLGHSFGGNVALEYTLRYPERVSHLVLVDTGGDSRWPLQNAAELTLSRSRSPKKAELVRRWFNGKFEPSEMIPMSLRILNLYFSRPSLWADARDLIAGEWKTKMRPETFIVASRHLLPGWSVMGRLGEIKAPTLVIAGRDDFVFPPECQLELASGISNARLQLIERAGHNPHSEQPAEVMQAVRDFLPAHSHPTP